jgi:hypothetical protein
MVLCGFLPQFGHFAASFYHLCPLTSHLPKYWLHFQQILRLESTSNVSREIYVETASHQPLTKNKMESVHIKGYGAYGNLP